MSSKRGSNKHMLARLYSLAQAAVFTLVLYLLSIITCQAILCNIRSLNFHSLSHSRLGKEDYFEDPAVQCSSKKKKDSKRDYVLIRGLLAVEQWNRCWLTINTRIQ
jgi:hypothetical protein